MLFDDKHTYGDFLNSEEKIATNILADRLLLLETTGIIIKVEHSESKVKSYYKITNKGLDLMPILFEMLIWSEKHLDVSERAQKAVDAIKKDRDGLMKKFREKYKYLNP